MEQNLPILKQKKLVYKGKFISYYIKEYEVHKQGKPPFIIPYEVTEYNSRNSENNEENNGFITKNKYNVYAVNILAIIKYKSKKSKILIIGNFRYPLNKYCLELPGGIIDKNDLSDDDFHKAIENACLRELEEETGYKGKYMGYTSGGVMSAYNGGNLNKEEQLNVCGNVFYDPWKSVDNAVQCIMTIDGDDEKNCKKQHLDESELIQVFEVEVDDLMEFINTKIQKDNFACCSQLYNFALGLNFNKIFK
jgi:8-oxo-dGTP pyrophosphatase MutT (NUDIX family)